MALNVRLSSEACERRRGNEVANEVAGNLVSSNNVCTGRERSRFIFVVTRVRSAALAPCVM